MAASGHVMLVTDGVFSMDGDRAPLSALARTAAEHGATLVVDDAHGIGVLGERGGGLCEAAGLAAEDVPVLVGTLGKAFGSAGAFVAGSAALIAHLENHARSMIYSTALSPAAARAALDALSAVADPSGPRRLLEQRIDAFRDGAERRGLELMPSDTPIQPLVVGSETAALARSAALEARGFLVTPIRPPTVPAGSSRLRITLSAGHEPAQVEGLLDALAATAA
jgi:8-amino-7-oxononanoate synthase